MSKKIVTLVVAIGLVGVAAGVGVWKRETRRAEAEDRARQERIAKDAKDSIGKAMGGLKMCPLSQPNCNDAK